MSEIGTFTGYAPGTAGQVHYTGTQDQWAAYRKRKGLVEGVNPDRPTDPSAVVKRPLLRWVFMAALDDYKEAIDQIIAAMPKTTPEEIEIEKIIRNKWEHGAEFNYEHKDMQKMMPMLVDKIPGFDPEAVWAAGEAVQYGSGS